MPLMTRRDVPFLAYSAATVSLRVFPKSMRLRWLIPISHRLGRAWLMLDRPAAQLCRGNMQRVLGDRLSPAELETAVRQHFYVITLGKMINDLLPELSLAELERFLRLGGSEQLQAAKEPGKGLLLLGSHIGLHGYSPMTLFQRHGYAFEAAVGEEFPIDSRVYRKFVHPVRSRNWSIMPVIPTSTGAPQRRMHLCLQEGKILLLWVDVVNEDLLRLRAPQVIRMPFLGHTMAFRTGALQLAQWMQVPTLPFFTPPRPDGGFTLQIEPPLTIHLEKSLDALRDNMAQYVTRLESRILANPGLWWQWRHPLLMEIMQL